MIHLLFALGHALRRTWLLAQTPRQTFAIGQDNDGPHNAVMQKHDAQVPPAFQGTVKELMASYECMR